MPLTVFEQASDATLDEECYLEANPDVRKAGMTAAGHFRNHGRAEGRIQFNPGYKKNIDAYRKRKFLLFRDILDLPAGILAKGTFPLTDGDSHFSLDQYLNEPSNSTRDPFNVEMEVHPDRLYLDIGCGFRTLLYENCLYLEVYPSRVADLVVQPTCTYPIKSSSLDGIGCFAVLEHTRKPWLVVQEMQRMLKPGGKVFIDWPFLQPVHGYPSHFFNATREGLRSLFEDNGFQIEIATTAPHQTPAYTVQWILGQMLQRLPEGKAKQALRKKTVADLAELSPHSEFWKTILSSLSDDAVSEFACGNWLVGFKK